jgi:hypothetical protein
MVKQARAERRELWNGFGSGLNTAIELAVVPAIFGLLGGLLDRVLDTGHLLTIAFLCFAFIGTFVKIYYAYLERMREEEKEKPWNRSAR